MHLKMDGNGNHQPLSPLDSFIKVFGTPLGLNFITFYTHTRIQALKNYPQSRHISVYTVKKNVFCMINARLSPPMPWVVVLDADNT